MAGTKTAKTATPRTRTTARKSSPAVVVDPDTYVPPTGLSEGFQGDGSVSLTRLMTRRAQSNVTELARSGNTDSARSYWNNALRSAGVLNTDAPNLSPLV